MSPRLIIAITVLASLTLNLVLAQEYEILEPQKKGEIEYENAQEEDDNFDATVLYDAEKPEEKPVQDTVKLDYENFTASNPDVEKAGGFDLYYSYLTYPLWYSPYYPCCPRSQYYDCRSVQQRLPCFYYNRRWCCPFWPTVYIANCNCGTCVRQCPTTKCFVNGKCYRRYSLRTFWAVCWNGKWEDFLYFKTYLPSSCYCGATC